MNNMTEQGVCDLLREKSLLTEKGISLVLNGDFVSLNVTAITAIVNAALASQASKGAGVVEGWALVPKEPTQEMKDEIIGCCTDDKLLTARYRAMLRAAPSPAQAQPVEAETHNFQVCQRFDNWLISQGLLLTTHTEEADGPMAPALNWIASVEAIRAQPVADPMDWPLPCDVTVGNGTHKKGVPLRSLVARMNVLHGMAKSQPVADAAMDKERLDFMDTCVMDHAVFRAERDWNPMRDSPTYGYLPTVTVFTVPSQHVKGIGLRAAIDAARALAAKPVE